MGAEGIIGKLYGLRPGEFVATRDIYVAEARRAKDLTAVKTRKALRRSALAAWAANLLARQRPEESARLLEVARTPRDAHRTHTGRTTVSS
ncbi:hypothetical protein ACIRQY_23040 [Streptomyces sp. NPDC101490]|uniref:hypothetical protein n=1 Tax=Streptomyces sp. NPDC101490 TaxID=3366143 RepID=UPI0037F2A53A